MKTEKRVITGRVDAPMGEFKSHAHGTHMTKKQFLEDVVRPNVDEFLANTGNLRLAFNAILSLDALVAHIWEWCTLHNPAEVANAPKDSQYRARLAKKNSNYRLLRDLAKAQKHVVLDDPKSKPLVKHSTALRRAKTVMAVLDDGSIQPVAPVVKKSLAFLETEIARLGVM